MAGRAGLRRDAEAALEHLADHLQLHRPGHPHVDALLPLGRGGQQGLLQGHQGQRPGEGGQGGLVQGPDQRTQAGGEVGGGGPLQ